MIGRLKLYLLLHRHERLSFRRSPAYEQSLAARVMMVLGAGFMMVYMIFAGTMFGSLANSSGDAALFMLFMPFFILELDFSMRFLVQ